MTLVTDHHIMPRPPNRKTRRAIKRPNGEGTIRLVGNRWRWEITLGYRPDGRRISLSGYADTRAAAVAAMQAALTDRRRKMLVDPDTVTVAEYAEKWLEQLTGIRHNTRKRFKQELGYALAHIGHLRVQEVNLDHIHQLLNALASQTMRRGNTMAPRTRKHVLAHLKRLFNSAVAANIIYRSPLHAMERQRFGLQLSAGDALNHKQAERFRAIGTALYDAGMCRLWLAALLAIITGLRRREVMSLIWERVDLDRNRVFVKVNQEWQDGKLVEVDPKNKPSFRSVPVPHWFTDLLRQHLARQLIEKEQAGSAWEDTGAVFATQLGAWTHHDNLTRTVARIIEWFDPATVEKRADAPYIWIGVPREKRQKLLEVVLSGEKLPSVSPHDLRHTYATLALRDGQDIAVVSRRMGHSRVSTTLDIYRHVDEDELEDAYDIYAPDNRRKK